MLDDVSTPCRATLYKMVLFWAMLSATSNLGNSPQLHQERAHFSDQTPITCFIHYCILPFSSFILLDQHIA